MILDFSKIEETVIPQFYGGEKEIKAHMKIDKNNKILLGTLEPGASIGLHTHETNSEIIYILSGKGKVLFEESTNRFLPDYVIIVHRDVLTA
ncbi:MAG: cupin domain-containing protein [Acutalibacteraceae bacterium]